MNNYKSILLLAITLILSSCATNYEEEKSVLLSKPETADLINQFDAEKKQAEINKDEEETKALEAKALVEAKKIDEKVKKIKVEIPMKPVVKSENSSVTAPTVKVADDSKVNVAKNLNLPEDYPEEYKAYDAKSQEAWAKFNPVFYQGEQSIMAVTYLGVTAGYITIMSKEVVTLNGKQAFHYYARFKSSDSYRYFYWLDDRLDSYVEKETFLPMKYSLVQREKKQNVDDLQLFDFKKMMTYNWYKRVKEGSDKDEKGEAQIPRLAQDSFSALQFVRGLPLIKGEIYELPVITRGKFWILKVEVMGEESTTVNGKDTQAIRIKAETNFPGVLKKSGDINFWYGTGPERRLLKFQAKVKIGSLYGEVVEYKPGKKVE
jgi:hypothetical protein